MGKHATESIKRHATAEGGGGGVGCEPPGVPVYFIQYPSLLYVVDMVWMRVAPSFSRGLTRLWMIEYSGSSHRCDGQFSTGTL
jgi:hypothetical protein